MKRVVFLNHGFGRHEGREWAEPIIALLKQQVTLLEDDRETGFQKERLQEAVEETLFWPLNYDDKYRKYVATMSRHKFVLIEAMKQAGFPSLASVFADNLDEESVLRDNIFDILIYRVMKDHRKATRNHLMLQIYKVLQEEGVDVDEVQYSVMAHSLGTVVMHDTLQEMSVDDGSAYQLGNEFHVHSLFMLANTSALLQTNYDPTRSNVRPFIAPSEPGYVRYYCDFAHKLDPVAQFFSYKQFIRNQPTKGFKFVTVDHYQAKDIYSFSHYLQDPRVYMEILQSLYGDRVVPSSYAKKVLRQRSSAPIGEDEERVRSMLVRRLEPLVQEGMKQDLDNALLMIARVLAELGRPGELQIETRTPMSVKEEESALDAVRHGRLAHVTSDFPGDVPGKKDQLNLQREIDAFSYLLAAEYLQPPLAIGLFGDWGAGKTFFMEQMEERVRDISNEARKEQEKGEKISFHSNIAQIRFNAWNFVDANLWASLVTRIFDGLAEHIRGKEEPLEQKRREIIAKLNRAQQLEKVVREGREVAEVAAERASERLQVLERECQEAEQDLEKKRSSITLDSINAEEIGQLLSREGRKALAKIQPTGRQIQDGKQMDEFIQQVKESFGILERLGIVSGGQMQWRKLALPALVTVFSVAIGYGVAGWSDKFHAVWAVFAPLLPGIPWATRALRSFNTYASRLEHDWNDSKESKLEEKRREILALVARELEWKLAEAENARQAHLLAQAGLVEAQRAVQELDPDRMFMSFIEAKAASEDYRSRLGLISQIREDLEDLTFLLKQDTDRREGRAKKPFWKSNGRAQGSDEEQKQEQEKRRGNKQESTSDIAWKASLPRIDRIILYIDDLDRCPPKRVAEVLQAVHLLLAFPLFVVVVGVDPRWLHRALEVHYPEFLSVTSEIRIEELEGTRERAATPRAYLEKIFQIPYVLPRIDESGFKQLVRNLAVAQERKAEDEARQQTHPATVSGREITEEQAKAEKEAALVQEEQPLIAQAEAPQADSRRGDVEEQDLDIAVQAEGRTEEKQLDSKRAVEVDLKMQSRPLSEDEIKFMESLYPLFRTPRSAKRLVNLYRLIKVTVPDPEEFAGGATDAGFRPTLMLLGIMIGFPEQGLELIDSLKREKNAREWWKFVETFRPLQERPRKKGQPPADNPTKHLVRAVQTSDAVRPYYWSRGLNRGLGREEGRQWSELCESLDRIRKAQSSKFSIVLLKRWIDRVTRYSFQAAVEARR